VFYLDNLDFGPLNSDQHIRPRYKAFSCDLVRNLVYEDKIEYGGSAIAEFGSTKVATVFKLYLCV
jgi:hypothetical protein